MKALKPQSKFFIAYDYFLNILYRKFIAENVNDEFDRLPNTNKQISIRIQLVRWNQKNYSLVFRKMFLGKAIILSNRIQKMRNSFFIVNIL